jgi:hypothetical protein
VAGARAEQASERASIIAVARSGRPTSGSRSEKFYWRTGGTVEGDEDS